MCSIFERVDDVVTCHGDIHGMKTYESLDHASVCPQYILNVTVDVGAFVQSAAT